MYFHSYLRSRKGISGAVGHIDFFCDPPAFSRPHLGFDASKRRKAPGANGCLRIAVTFFEIVVGNTTIFAPVILFSWPISSVFFSPMCWLSTVSVRPVPIRAMYIHDRRARRTPKSVGSFDLSLRRYLLRSRILF